MMFLSTSASVVPLFMSWYSLWCLSAPVTCPQEAIGRLRPLNPVSLSVSSRTDKGVHALSNSAHFDLQRKDDKPPFPEDLLVQALNFHLKSEDIRWARALPKSTVAKHNAFFFGPFITPCKSSLLVYFITIVKLLSLLFATLYQRTVMSQPEDIN